LIDINQAGTNIDTRIKGENDDSLFYVDASTDFIGVGTSTPEEKFDVIGSVKANSYVFDQQASDLSAPSTDRDELYSKSTGLYHIENNGTISYIPRVLDASHVDVEVASTDAETNLWSYTLKGGMLGTDGSVEVEAFVSYLNASGVNRTITLKLYYDTAVITIFANTFGSNAARRLIHIKGIIRADAATNAQKLESAVTHTLVASGGDVALTGANNEGTGAIDSTADKVIKITAQHSASASSISAILRNLKATYVPTV